MSFSIKTFLFVAVVFILQACNNSARPQEETSEKSQDFKPNTEMSSDMTNDTQSAPAFDMSKTAKAKALSENEAMSTEPKASAKLVNLTDSNTRPSTQPKTDADRLRQMAADKANNAKPSQAQEKQAKPVKKAKKVTAKTVSNSKVASPTNAPSKPTPVEKPALKPNHSAWNSLLTSFVSSSGKVDYRGFKSSQAKLDAYLQDLKNNPPAADWSRNEKMAYWINAYNAFTVKKIVENYPLKSITDLSGGKVWDDKWISIGGKTYSLNDIENGILRPTYKDARIHFAVNCAAKSCPPLHNRAFTASNLNSKLESLTKKFINNDNYTSISADAAEVSKIFDWYKDDFGNLNDYLNKYSETKLNTGAAINFKEYDWALNE